MVTILGKMNLISQVLKKNLHLYKVLQYSTAAAPAVQNQLPRFKTLENNPTRHTYDHVGKFYTIDQPLKEKLYVLGGIPLPLKLQMETFRENCLMVREPALEIMSFIKQINFSQPAVRFVLYGKHGTGKSSTIGHLVHYGYESKFLLLHVPWVSEWTKRPKEVEPSQYKEGMIDLPVESVKWLQHFQSQNAELMQELDLKTSESYTWSKREVTEKGEPLMAVLEHGLARGRHSSDCMAVLLKEIKLQSKSNKFKVMVLVDGINAFFCHTNVHRPDKTMVRGDEITICKAFMNIVKNDWNNAVIITSADIMPKNRDFKHKDSVMPRDLLGKEGFELLDPFVPIETKNYTEKEIESVLDYYTERRWIQSEKARSESGRKQLKFLSGYNPLELLTLCEPL